MRKGGKIMFFTALFVVVLCAPFILNMGSAQAAPDPSLDTPEINALEEKECIADTEWMRENHMQLLDDWRWEVIRNGATEYVAPNGQVYDMSLDDTCLSCHSNREEFCETCHDYSNVELYCWDCHNPDYEE